jgi:hypothetical protein
VTDIRGLLYDSGTISYKLRHGHEWIRLITRCPTRAISHLPLQIAPAHLYTSKISADKYAHTQDLKAMIPVEYHNFYDSIPHN